MSIVDLILDIILTLGGTLCLGVACSAALALVPGGRTTAGVYS